MPTRYPPNRHPTPFEQHADQVLERAAKPCCKLSQVLDKVRDSGKAENISAAVQECIAKVRKPGDEETASYAIEMALQYGAEYIDDDAEIIAMTDSRLADMMMVLGYGRTPKPAPEAPPKPEPRPERPPVPEPNLSRPGHAGVNVLPGYTGLLGVLVEALNQAQYGKGAERHNLGGDTPFERQRMQQISELIDSPKGMAYQICKKVTEGLDMLELERQVHELLGAINYIAGTIIYLRKKAAQAGAADPIDDTPTWREVVDAALRLKEKLGPTAGKLFVRRFSAESIGALPVDKWADFIAACDKAIAEAPGQVQPEH